MTYTYTDTLPLTQQQVGKLADAMALVYNRPDTIPNPEWTPDSPPEIPTEIDNPESKADFFKRKTREYWRNIWKQARVELAEKAARDAEIAAVESEFDING